MSHTDSRVLDSFAWIEYLQGGIRGERVKDYVDGSNPIYTPAICLTEIASKYLREGRDPKDRMAFIMDRSLIIDIDAPIALDAANMRHKYGLHTIDALIYASSRSRRRPLITGDEHFRSVPDVEMI